MESYFIAVFLGRSSPEEGQEILCEIHEGDCGHHAGSKSLVAKAFRHGFYWLTAHADAEDLVSRCDGMSEIRMTGACAGSRAPDDSNHLAVCSLGA